MAIRKFKNPWLKRHVADPYVKLAQQQGFRSRAAYKLLSIQEKDHILKPHDTILDLGAAPGAWSQIAQQHVREFGQVIAIDRLPMQPIKGVRFIQGDLENEATLDTLYQTIGPTGVDVVLSDLAPNLSGLASIDQPRSYALIDLARCIAMETLKKNGIFLVKCFQGKGFDSYFRTLGTCFRRVFTRKPIASRTSSREVYLLARGYHQ